MLSCYKPLSSWHYLHFASIRYSILGLLKYITFIKFCILIYLIHISDWNLLRSRTNTRSVRTPFSPSARKAWLYKRSNKTWETWMETSMHTRETCARPIPTSRRWTSTDPSSNCTRTTSWMASNMRRATVSGNLVAEPEELCTSLQENAR